MTHPGSRLIPGFASLAMLGLLQLGPAQTAQAQAASPERSAYLAELVDRSRHLGLAGRREWLKLGHYEPDFLGAGFHGLVISPGFYNAPGGRTDPQAELEATLARFVVEDAPAVAAAPPADGSAAHADPDPQCRFIARYAWLDEELAFDATRLAHRPCPRYESWRAALDPGGLTLVFASAYINSPASMYGHTFLRVDAKDQDEQTRLLAYAINFAANTRDTNGIAFAVNGLFGGYAGTFSILPYYAKVSEYSDLESRDLWEYRLQLGPREIERVLMHAWELGPAYFHYYFFDENCSYHLLGLLQVARADLDLTAGFRWWAVPTDTVRAVTAHADLIAAVVYRPALATRLRQAIAPMDATERQLVGDLSERRRGPGDPALAALAPRRAAAVIEAAQEYVEYRRVSGKGAMADAAALELDLLAARSRIAVAAQSPPVVEPATRPDQGHGSARVQAGAGRWDGRDYQELAFRPAYQDILDDDGGFVRGAQVEFFRATAHRFGDGSARIEELMPLHLVSLTPRDDFFQSPSWEFRTGWRRIRLPDGRQPLAFGVSGGGGGAWSDQRSALLGYARLEGGLRLDRGIAQGYEVGAGIMAGLLADVAQRWRVHAYLRGQRDILGYRQTPWTVGLEQRVSLGRDIALRLDFARVHDFSRIDDNASVNLLVYF